MRLRVFLPGELIMGGLWSLIAGLMVTIFGGMALCYGLVKLVEKVVLGFRAGHAKPAAPQSLPRAA